MSDVLKINKKTMKHFGILIVLLLFSTISIGQPLVNFLIQVVDENNYPIEGFKLFIKHPNWDNDHWIPAEGKYSNPSISEEKFITSFTMNNNRHDVKFNLFSTLSGISDIYSNFPQGSTSKIDIKLTKNGYRDILEQLTIKNRGRHQYTLIERNYLAYRSRNRQNIHIQQNNYNSSREGSNESNSVKQGYFTDTRDNQIYKIVTIGNQTWFAENLNYKTNNSRCYQNNSSICQTYGRLYNFDDAYYRSCPEGWHLPSDNEWKILEGKTDSKFPVGDNEWDKEQPRGSDVGSSLKDDSGWSPYNGNDSFNFNALAGGYINDRGKDMFLKEMGAWWTSTPYNNNNAWLRKLYGQWPASGRYTGNTKSFLSIRCVKN